MKEQINYYPSGVYAIQNVTKGIFYIGSSENIENRWKQHQTMLKNNKHFNKKLQNDYNDGDVLIYGLIKDTFPDRRQLLYEEQFYIRNWKRNGIKLYNVAKMTGTYYTSKTYLQQIIVDKYCKERFGRTFDQLFSRHNPAVYDMYYEIITNEPEKEIEIRNKYKDLKSYFEKWFYSLRKKAS